MFKLFGKQTSVSDPSTQKLTFKISGMHCVSCSMNIDGELEDVDGVVSASTSYARSVCTVSFDAKKTSQKQIISTIQKLGYKVIEN